MEDAPVWHIHGLLAGCGHTVCISISHKACMLLSGSFYQIMGVHYMLRWSSTNMYIPASATLQKKKSGQVYKEFLGARLVV
jgi:hypothetical protein